MPAASNFRANGTIQPSTIVKLDPSKPGFNVIAASAATDKPVGIAQEGSYDPPGLAGSLPDAARAGLPLRVYQEGDECLLMIGAGGCTAGDSLTSDASGNGITEAFGGVFATPPRWIVAQALETANAGEKARVRVGIKLLSSST